jgi:threonine/homoserine/homoserine lactone efflux protein
LPSPLTLTAILLGGTLTPGPNNLALLDIAARAGRRAALSAIVAIVSGGLMLYACVYAGLAAWISRAPWAKRAMIVCSASYLVWLGISFIYRSFRPSPRRLLRRSAMSTFGLLAFQFVNPKAWLLMISLSSAAQCAKACTWVNTLTPFGLLIIIPTLSLLTWLLVSSGLGRLARLDLENPLVQRVAGVLLLASALSLRGA